MSNTDAAASVTAMSTATNTSAITVQPMAVRSSFQSGSAPRRRATTPCGAAVAPDSSAAPSAASLSSRTSVSSRMPTTYAAISVWRAALSSVTGDHTGKRKFTAQPPGTSTSHPSRVLTARASAPGFRVS